MMACKIKIDNPANRFSNPLLRLKDKTFPTYFEACDDVFEAIYPVVNGENGCEMVNRPNDVINGDDDDASYAALEKYIDDCEKYIRENGHASEDGVTAIIEEAGTLYVCDRDGNNAEPINIEDEPICHDEVLSMYDQAMEPGYVLRAATTEDDVAPSVDFVAYKAETGEVTDFYKFVV